MRRGNADFRPGSNVSINSEAQSGKQADNKEMNGEAAIQKQAARVQTFTKETRSAVLQLDNCMHVSDCDLCCPRVDPGFAY